MSNLNRVYQTGMAVAFPSGGSARCGDELRMDEVSGIIAVCDVQSTPKAQVADERTAGEGDTRYDSQGTAQIFVVDEQDILTSAFSDEWNDLTEVPDEGPPEVPDEGPPLPSVFSLATTRGEPAGLALALEDESQQGREYREPSCPQAESANLRTTPPPRPKRLRLAVMEPELPTWQPPHRPSPAPPRPTWRPPHRPSPPPPRPSNSLAPLDSAASARRGSGRAASNVPFLNSALGSLPCVSRPSVPTPPPSRAPRASTPSRSSGASTPSRAPRASTPSRSSGAPTVPPMTSAMADSASPRLSQPAQYYAQAAAPLESRVPRAAQGPGSIAAVAFLAGTILGVLAYRSFELVQWAVEQQSEATVYQIPAFEAPAPQTPPW